MKLSSIEKTIINGMARAFFVSAWAEKQERKGRSFSGQELMDVAPSTPRYARDFALMYAGGLGSLLVHLNNAARADIMELANISKWPKYGDMTEAERAALDEMVDGLKVEGYASEFGHYLAMMAMGTGVSWFDDHARFEIDIHHMEANL